MRELEDAGVQCEALELASFDGLRGLISAAYWQAAPWYQQLALWLVAEEAKGAESPWANYITLLPRTVATPLHWSPEQLAKLEYPAIALAVQEQRTHFEELTASARQHLVAGAPAHAMDSLEWAMEMVLSRALDSADHAPKDEGFLADVLAQLSGRPQKLKGVGNKAMCPMLDMINHDHGARPRFSYDARQDVFSVAADRNYPKGQQVFITYGDKDNDDLLMLYGFILQDNPHDIYSLTGLSEWLVTSCEHTRTSDPLGRIKRLEDRGMRAALETGFVSRQDGFAPALLHALRVFVATPTELSASADHDYAACISPDNEAAVLDVLKQYCVYLLASKIQKPSSDDPVEDMIVKFRLAKRKVLKELFYKSSFSI